MTSISAILSANGGLHSKRAMKKVKDRLQNHGMKRAILVHMVITGSQSVQVYRDTYNDIADHIRDNGSRCEYFGCLEMDEDKGLHAHVYFVIETSKKFPHASLDVKDGAWLHRLAERRGLVNEDGTTRRIHIAQPKNKIHFAKGNPQFFARLDDEAKLADCLERVEYLYKNRSKENVPSREIYFNSNFESNKAKRAKKKPASLPPAALPAAEPVVTPTTETKGEELTPADKYIASKYETAVGKQLDIEAIRLYLLSHGIKRTPGQVVFDLDERFSFYGYAASHPAPRRLTYAEIDKQLGKEDRRPSRNDRLPGIQAESLVDVATEGRRVKQLEFEQERIARRMRSIGTCQPKRPSLLEGVRYHHRALPAPLG